MSDSGAFLAGAGWVLLGVLMILGRNLYASFMLMLLRGFDRKKLDTEGVRRFCSIGMAAFGGLVVIIGVVSAVGAL